MKYQFLAVSVAVLCAGLAHADDYKHPSDKCPKGTHSVTIEKKLDAGVNTVITGTFGTTEKREVCRDNKPDGVREFPKRR